VNVQKYITNYAGRVFNGGATNEDPRLDETEEKGLNTLGPMQTPSFLAKKIYSRQRRSGCGSSGRGKFARQPNTGIMGSLSIGWIISGRGIQ